MMWTGLYSPIRTSTAFTAMSESNGGALKCSRMNCRGNSTFHSIFRGPTNWLTHVQHLATFFRTCWPDMTIGGSVISTSYSVRLPSSLRQRSRRDTTSYSGVVTSASTAIPQRLETGFATRGSGLAFVNQWRIHQSNTGTNGRGLTESFPVWALRHGIRSISDSTSTLITIYPG